MKQTEPVQYCKNLLYILGKEEKTKLLEKSNLTEKEKVIIKYRFVDGLTVKETCELLGFEENAFNKAQQKVLFKLYFWLSNKEQVEKLVEKLQIYS